MPLFGGLILCIVVGFINYQGDRALKYISHFNTGDTVLKKDLIKTLLKIYLTIFILAFFSFNLLWFFTPLLFCVLLLLIIQFGILWKNNGHSVALFTLSTVAVTIGSFIISPLIRNIIL